MRRMPRLPTARAIRVAATAALLLTLATLAAHTPDARAHPHHDAPSSDPQFIGLVDPENDGLRLLVRHLSDGAATRSAQALDVGRPDAPRDLADHAHSYPAAPALGGTDFILLVDPAFFPPQTDSYHATATLVRTLRRAFTPGDRIRFHLLQDDEPLSHRLDEELDAVTDALTQLMPSALGSLPSDPADALSRTLRRAISERDALRTHRELIVLAGPQAARISGDKLPSHDTLRDHLLPIHFVSPSPDDDSLQTSALCTLAVTSAGTCHTAPHHPPRPDHDPPADEHTDNHDPPADEESDSSPWRTPIEALERHVHAAFAAATSVFLTTIRCAERPLPNPYPLVLSTPTADSGPHHMPANRLQCESYDDSVPALVEASDDEVPVSLARRMQPLWFGLVLVVLLGALVFMGRTARAIRSSAKREK